MICLLLNNGFSNTVHPWPRSYFQREITVHDEHGAWTSSVRSSATVLDLLRAHRTQAEWNEAGSLYAHDQRLPLAQKLAHHHGPFQYVSSQGIAAQPVPHDRIVVLIQHEGQTHVQLLHQDQFLFEALGNIQLSNIKHLVDVRGQIFIQRSPDLEALDFWPPALPGPSAHGSTMALPGLHSLQVWSCLQHLQLLVDNQCCLWLHPGTSSQTCSICPSTS